jgi:ATP-dependent 26S proteasome regulatory subunit
LDGSKWTDLISATDRFVGAELEQIICDARFNAFARAQTGQPVIEEFLEAASKVIPIADGEKENIEEIRKLSEGKARPVSKVRKPMVTKAVSKRAVTV